MNTPTTAQPPQTVTRQQLPFCCPPRQENPAASHPRVFIPLKKPGEARSCPYCGTRYQLAAHE